MSSKNMRHHLLSPHEAELIACYRLLSEPAQNTISTIVASQITHKCRKLDTTTKLTLIHNTRPLKHR